MVYVEFCGVEAEQVSTRQQRSRPDHVAYARACVYIYKNLDLKYRVQILRKMTRGRESETKRERARQRERGEGGRERERDAQSSPSL